MREPDFETGAASERAEKGTASAADHHLLAVHAYRKGELARALEHNERSRSLGAPVAAPAYLRGLVLREMGRLDEAARAFEEAADAAPDRDRLRAKALSSLGAVRCLEGDPRAALEPLSRACWLR
ncbi:tetratricopeptide repeat protein, partial [bacterium]|nr:tetratricopeptide repeat protein [bacterium]